MKNVIIAHYYNNGCRNIETIFSKPRRKEQMWKHSKNLLNNHSKVTYLLFSFFFTVISTEHKLKFPLTQSHSNFEFMYTCMCLRG